MLISEQTILGLENDGLVDDDMILSLEQVEEGDGMDSSDAFKFNELEYEEEEEEDGMEGSLCVALKVDDGS